MAKYKKGDRVKLDTPTSPIMIVENVAESRIRTDYDCVWFDGPTKPAHRATFEEVLLFLDPPFEP